MRLIVRIKDKSVVKELKRFCKVSYVSELINVVGLDIKAREIYKIKEIDGVVDVRESSKAAILIMDWNFVWIILLAHYSNN